MFGFLIGAGLTASVCGGVVLGIYRKDKNDSSMKKTPNLKEIFNFFKDVKKGKVITKDNGFYDFLIKNDEVSAYIFDYGENIKRVIMYVGTKKLFSLKYDLSNNIFISFDDEYNTLKTDFMDEFVSEFHYFMVVCYEKRPLQDVVSLLNGSTTVEQEKETINWLDYLPKIQQAHIKELLLCIAEGLEELHMKKDELELEDIHRFERLETDILPSLLESFCSLESDEQEKQEAFLVNGLTSANEKVKELQEKFTKKTEFTFQKNMELLKHL